MALITLAQARTALWQYGKIGVPLVSATTAQKEAFRDKLNRVSERLLGMCKPKHTMRRVNLPVYDGMITLPRHLANCVGAKVVTGCCGSGMLIYTKFHEFAQMGGMDCCGSVQPATEVAQTFRIPATGFTLRVKSTVAGGIMSFIGGRDASWDEYFGAVTVTIVNGSVDTARIWNALPMIQKPITTVAIELYSVIDGTETLIAIYGPQETVPAYMRYLVPAACDGDLVMALCKLAYVPAIDETDIVFPCNYGALEKGLDALDRDSKADYARGATLWGEALQILDEDRKEFDGDAQPVINMLGGLGAADIYAVR